jgi:hypothetical protein
MDERLANRLAMLVPRQGEIFGDLIEGHEQLVIEGAFSKFWSKKG